MVKVYVPLRHWIARRRGIVDSHGLMMRLLGLFEDAGGVTALNSPVVSIKPLGLTPGSAGWEVQVKDAATGETSAITGETLINAAGLGAVDVHNMILPTPSRLPPHLSGSEPGAAGLGTHLILDLGGHLRFGPEVEWVAHPDDLAVNASRFPQAVGEIKKYLPSVDETLLVPDYAGIRPKLSDRGAVLKGKSFNDFILRKEDGYDGWVNLLGIGSPGLTSSLAIAEKFEELMYGTAQV
ncbi:hypothetical protein B0J13DRAFT_660764 [Dactylonectria estremocensis]|uniref:L-2-hydroxyglutarate dehydrogenase, mitochondrial n=1 Tax=Dactylonectria estremocensis TaxID=1079267 RepID=A0A9P9F1E1_9HYPO|nr:hypothetical protein B0J13DRAFT_660764 [Dactylonectria estremocensis]